MVQAVSHCMTFDEFVAWYPEDGRYELVNGRVCEVKPTGPILNQVLNAASLTGIEP